MQCCRAGFLGAGQNEIQPLDLSRLRPPHRHESRTVNGIAQLISQKSGCADIVDLFCNGAGRFPVLSSNGPCFEGVHARDVDFRRDYNRRFLRCLACCNRRPRLSGGAQTEPCVRNSRRSAGSIQSWPTPRMDRQVIEPELSRTRQHFMLLDVHCLRNFAKIKTRCHCVRNWLPCIRRC
jgi:hypothetical protein